MKIRFFYSIIVTVLMMNGCDKAPTSPSQDFYLVFGHFYGECIGETCIEIFKIENGKLYEDTLDYYPGYNNLPHNASYVQRSNDKYEKVKYIPDLIPNELYSENAIVIGQPDAGDWGGLYLETNKTGKKEYWLIDKMKNNIPEYLHAFVDSLDDAIQKLQ